MPNLLLLPALLMAQDAPSRRAELVTDRPDFTESAVVVPNGSLQVELGSTWRRTGGSHSVSGAEPLARWGVLGDVELRFGLPAVVRSDGATGVTDGTVGAKVALGSPLGWDLALIAEAGVPTGDSRFGADGAEGALVVTTGRALGERWSIGTQISGVWTSAPTGNLVVDYTLVLGRSITSRVSTFAEAAVSTFDEAPPPVLLHHGYAVLVSRQLQLDVHMGLGINDTAPDALVGMGFSARFGR